MRKLQCWIEDELDCDKFLSEIKDTELGKECTIGATNMDGTINTLK